MNVGHSANKKAVLEELLDLGMVLVAIDARVPGVDVPAHLEIDPQLRLNLSYRFGRPMQVDAWGITADLTFGGVPHACRFPWDAIFLMVSHVNGEPYLFPDQVPQELIGQATGEFAAAATPNAGKARAKTAPKLSLVRADDAPPAPNESTAPDHGADLRAAEPRQDTAPRTAPADAHDDDEAPAPMPAAAVDADADSEAADAPPGASPPATIKRRGHLRLVK